MCIDILKTYFLNILNLYRVKRKFIELCFGVIWLSEFCWNFESIFLTLNIVRFHVLESF